jgi:PspC domain
MQAVRNRRFACLHKAAAAGLSPFVTAKRLRGIARYLDADVTLVRVIIAALYITAWLLIPADGEDQSVAAAWIADRRDRFAES